MFEFLRQQRAAGPYATEYRHMGSYLELLEKSKIQQVIIAQPLRLIVLLWPCRDRQLLLQQRASAKPISANVYSILLGKYSQVFVYLSIRLGLNLVLKAASRQCSCKANCMLQLWLASCIELCINPYHSTRLAHPKVLWWPRMRRSRRIHSVVPDSVPLYPSVRQHTHLLSANQFECWAGLTDQVARKLRAAVSAKAYEKMTVHRG